MASYMPNTYVVKNKLFMNFPCPAMFEFTSTAIAAAVTTAKYRDDSLFFAFFEKHKCWNRMCRFLSFLFAFYDRKTKPERIVYFAWREECRSMAGTRIHMVNGVANMLVACVCLCTSKSFIWKKTTLASLFLRIRYYMWRYVVLLFYTQYTILKVISPVSPPKLPPS